MPPVGVGAPRPPDQAKALIDAYFVQKLRCPATGQSLRLDGNQLVTPDGARRYPVTETGIARLSGEGDSTAGAAQGEHYDRIAAAYMANLASPPTQEYMAYLDRALVDTVSSSDLSDVVEVCCGHGEGFGLLGDRVSHGVGVDISAQMLEFARGRNVSPRLFFAQGDATRLPLASDAFSAVLMLGGIHHVPDRVALFREVHRVLQPGGRFFWREPVSDLWIWRWLRAIIYRVSPMLDASTERPLTHEETVPVLEQVGFRVQSWQTYGLLGFCLFMNSDVLVFNRLFGYLPGIRQVTRWSTRLDDWMTRLPWLRRAGLQVIGAAQKVG
jgi:ubiquinone/menaquinone biosynthesis C-methylase UbiE